MGCKGSRERIIAEILVQAEGKINEQDIEEIMMNT